MSAAVISALVSLLSGLANAFVSFMSWLHEQELVQSGIAKQQLSDLKAQVDAAHQAILIREATRISDERNGLPINDEFDRDK